MPPKRAGYKASRTGNPVAPVELYRGIVVMPKEGMLADMVTWKTLSFKKFRRTK
jgi:hypothetical protein